MGPGAARVQWLYPSGAATLQPALDSRGAPERPPPKPRIEHPMRPYSGTVPWLTLAAGALFGLGLPPGVRAQTSSESPEPARAASSSTYDHAATPVAQAVR